MVDKKQLTPFQKLAKRIFAVRSFKGQDPELIRERFRLVSGLVRDVVDGRLSEATAKRLAREVSDRLLAGGPLGPGPSVRPARISKALLALFGRDHVLWREELRLHQHGRMRRFS